MIVFGFRLVTAALLAFLMLALPAAGQIPSGANHIAAALVSETATPRAGRTVTLAFVMTPEAGWHGYWENPGDAGVQTEVDWTLPAGVTAGPLRYQVPDTLIVSGLMNYVYEGPYAQLVDLKIPTDLATGTRLPIRAKIDWLACTREICVPEHGEFSTVLTIGDGAITAANRAKFDGYRTALPKPLSSRASFTMENGRIRMAVPLPAALEIADPYFFPLTDGVIDYAAPQQVTRNDDMVIVETGAGEMSARTIDGVLRIGPNAGLRLSAVPGAVPAAGESVTSDAGVTLLVALGGAVLGGLLLNVMPCVFPILSLKALSLARAGGDERAVRREALAYAGGVIVVCLMLGGLVLALRAGGDAVGWAFQLQEPRVILVLLLLTAGIAFNLAGLFELPSLSGGSALAGRSGAAGAFWTGALAAFVATPCTGPFMAAALGAALVMPTAAALAVFAGLGLGLALPFLLLGFIPALRRALPRPGSWMERLRRILSLPMFATALGLAWILGRQVGVDGMMFGLTALLLLALALWWVGARQAGGRSTVWWPLVPAATAAVALVAIVPRNPATAGPVQIAGAEPFNRARLATLRAEGKPVFLYFTADWCLTCKVNEKGAIDRADVRAAFAKRNVVVMVGDWTRGNADISRFLAEHGRSGVPLYLFAPPGGPWRVLPQVLTPGMLTGLVA